MGCDRSDGVMGRRGEAPWQPWVCAKKLVWNGYHVLLGQKVCRALCGYGNRLDRDDQLSITRYDFF